MPSSSLTLAGLLYHLALVEESWAVERFAGGPSPEPWAADDVLAATGDLDALSVAPLRNGGRLSVRWMLLHLLDDTSRHNGHADLLREAVDGVTGE